MDEKYAQAIRSLSRDLHDILKNVRVPLHGKPARRPGAYQEESDTAEFGRKWLYEDRKNT